MATKGLMPTVGGRTPSSIFFPLSIPVPDHLITSPTLTRYRSYFLGLRLSLRTQSGSSHSWQEGRSFTQQQCLGGPLCTGPSYDLSKDTRTLQSRVSVTLHTDQQAHGNQGATYSKHRRLA